MIIPILQTGKAIEQGIRSRTRDRINVSCDLTIKSSFSGLFKPKFSGAMLGFWPSIWKLIPISSSQNGGWKDRMTQVLLGRVSLMPQIQILQSKQPRCAAEFQRTSDFPSSQEPCRSPGALQIPALTSTGGAIPTGTLTRQ